MRNYFTAYTFAKKLGYKDAQAQGFRKDVNFLAEHKIILVQQSGFRSDSFNHHKVYIIKNMNKFLRFVGADDGVIIAPTTDEESTNISFDEPPDEKPKPAPKPNMHISKHNFIWENLLEIAHYKEARLNAPAKRPTKW
jgi:hypothetical protein